MNFGFPSPFGVHSFLINSIKHIRDGKFLLSFRLLSEFTHFLFIFSFSEMNEEEKTFPSPFGVLSFLIFKRQDTNDVYL